MTPPHTRLITSATAPLPWITVGSPGYLTVISSLEDWRGGWWESTSQTALRRETGWLEVGLRRFGRRLRASRRPLSSVRRDSGCALQSSWLLASPLRRGVL